MQISLSLPDLFFKTFGYQTEAFDPKVDPISGDKNGSRVNTGKHGSPYYASDAVGNEYFLPIEVVVGSDNAEALGATDDSGIPTGRWNLPYPVMAVALNKHIIDTELTERNGVVSELINSGGYKFTIKGFVVNQLGNNYPEADWDTLNRLVNLGIPVKINNPVSDVCFAANGNTAKTVTIRNFQCPDRAGVKHVRAYEMEMWTDIPFNLIEVD